MTLGFVDPAVWQLPTDLLSSDREYTKQVKATYDEAVHRVQQAGCKVHYPVALPHPSDDIFQFHGQSGWSLIFGAEIRDSFNAYLQTLSSTKINSMADLIRYNDDHPDQQAGLDQAVLIQAQEDATPEKLLEEARRAMRKAARSGAIDMVMDKYGLDAVVAPMDSPISTIASLAGYPVGTMPLGILRPSGRPYGLAIVTKSGQEGKILDVMGAYEAVSPPRPLPPLLRSELQRGI